VTDDIVIQSWELLDLALTLQLSHKIFGASYRINGKSKTSRINILHHLQTQCELVPKQLTASTASI